MRLYDNQAARYAVNSAYYFDHYSMLTGLRGTSHGRHVDVYTYVDKYMFSPDPI